MIWIILIIVIFAYIYYLIVIKNGNHAFWKFVAKDPEFFYNKIINSKNWIILENQPINKETNWVGPFRLYIPKLDKQILFFGVHPYYLEDQKQFVLDFKERK